MVVQNLDECGSVESLHQKHQKGESEEIHMRIRLSALMALLVAGELYTQNSLGQDLRQFAKMTLEPGQFRHHVERVASQELSIKERLKRAEASLERESEASNMERFRASLDVSEPIEFDGGRETFPLDTVYFGQGNVRTATTTAGLWQWTITSRDSITFTGVFIDPGKRDNVWGGFVWRHSFGR